jgi:hypothetical protein
MEGDLASQPFKTETSARQTCTLEDKLGAFMLYKDALDQSGVENEMSKVNDKLTQQLKKGQEERICDVGFGWEGPGAMD